MSVPVDFQTWSKGMASPARPRIRLLRRYFLVSILAITALGIVQCRRPPETPRLETNVLPSSSPDYAGVESCSGCHTQAADAWRNSQHARAMQEANESTVLGTFQNGRFTKD